MKVVWTDGKPPRYWLVFVYGLITFCSVWMLFSFFAFWHFARTAPDATHSASLFRNGAFYYFPRFILWFHDFGLFIVMGWFLVAAAISSFYRKEVPGDQ